MSSRLRSSRFFVITSGYGRIIKNIREEKPKQTGGTEIVATYTVEFGAGDLEVTCNGSVKKDVKHDLALTSSNCNLKYSDSPTDEVFTKTLASGKFDDGTILYIKPICADGYMLPAFDSTGFNVKFYFDEQKEGQDVPVPEEQALPLAYYNSSTNLISIVMKFKVKMVCNAILKPAGFSVTTDLTRCSATITATNPAPISTNCYSAGTKIDYALESVEGYVLPSNHFGLSVVGANIINYAVADDAKTATLQIEIAKDTTLTCIANKNDDYEGGPIPDDEDEEGYNEVTYDIAKSWIIAAHWDEKERNRITLDNDSAIISWNFTPSDPVIAEKNNFSGVLSAIGGNFSNNMHVYNADIIFKNYINTKQYGFEPSTGDNMRAAYSMVFYGVSTEGESAAFISNTFEKMYADAPEGTRFFVNENTNSLKLIIPHSLSGGLEGSMKTTVRYTYGVGMYFQCSIDGLTTSLHGEDGENKKRELKGFLSYDFSETYTESVPNN